MYYVYIYIYIYISIYLHINRHILYLILHLPENCRPPAPAVLFAHGAARRLDPRALRRVARAVVPGDLQCRCRRAPQQSTGVTKVGHLGMALGMAMDGRGQILGEQWDGRAGS